MKRADEPEEASAVVFRLLGSVELRATDGRLLPAGRRKQRALLALLLLRAGTVVRVDEMIDALWDARPPSSARANLHSYISGLRQVLARALPRGEARLVKTSGGYRFDVRPGEYDVTAFEALAAEGRQALDDARYPQAVELLTRALQLWRGPLLEDLAAEVDWFAPYAERLTQARLSALEDQVEARLALGEYAELAVELAATTADHPLRERFWGQYIRALQQTGDRARALSAYERLRVVLRAELGVEPSRALQDLRAELCDDVSGAPSARYSPVSPNLLPPAVKDFTGRSLEVRGLRDLLSSPQTSAGLTVAAITGMAGIGKTTLAIHLAHSIAPAYPDGQIYTNLAGAGSTPLDPVDVLGRFLRALGVPSRAVPSDPLERAELYRSVLSGRRVLVVLDNAGSEQQVRPLLPGAAGCAVLLTSRSRLSGLEGARWSELGVLSDVEATQLLARIVNDPRIEDPSTVTTSQDVEAIVRICGGLPLAVRIAGARLTSRPGWTVAHLVALLRDEQRRLDRLGVGDLQVRASLALSYDGLEPSAQRLLRRLSVFDVPDFPGWLATVTSPGPAEETAADLDVLVDAHVLSVVGTDSTRQVRYRFHDLIRLFARDRARAEDSPAELEELLRHGFGAWLAIAERLEPGVPGPCFAPIRGSAIRPPVESIMSELAGIEPLAWFEAEQTTIQAAIRQACENGYDELAFDLAQRMEKYFDVRGMYTEWEAGNRLAMTACQAAGNLRGEAVMLRGLVDVTTWITADDDTEAMRRSHADAVRLQDLFAKVDERGGMADAAVMRSWSLTAMGRHDEAVGAATESLGWAGEASHLGGQARAHVALAVAAGQSGQLQSAVEHLHQALACARELGNARYESTVLQFLGIGHCEAGQFDVSKTFLDQSLEISRRLRDTYTEVLTLIAMARLHVRRNDAEAAPTAEAALALAREYRMTHHIADSLGLLGEIELNAGRPQQAAVYLRESIALWRTRGWLRFLAAALALLGRALSTLDRQEARAALQEAGDLYVQAGDSAGADTAAQLLRDL